MALADTARLIASLELQDKFSGTARNAERSLGGIEGATQRAGRQMGLFGHAAATALGVGLERAISAGVRGLVGAVTGGVESLNELESVTTATNTVIESTGGVAGVSAQEVRDLAEEYEGLNATMDDKVIQSGENLLLTFTNISDKAFEPALEAALNMNEAMGGGPEGLQSTIIQLGKALQDPVRGATALRRVGVNLSKQQQDQIKTLVEQNDLYGAQQILLDELATEFGGRFAAAGQTAEGRQAAFNDRIEDLQKALAGPLMPAIDRTREALIKLFESPAALAAANKIGEALADLFSDQNLSRLSGFLEDSLNNLADLDLSGVGDTLSNAMGIIGDLPWGAIGDAFQLMGTGARAAFDLFTSMPPWVQTAVLTGWGLNKLTGGALGSIVASLGSGLVKGVLGMNAGVVNINAATVNGGIGAGVPAAAGRGGGLAAGLLKGAGIVLGAGAAAAIGFEIGQAINENTVAPAREFETDQVDKVAASQNAEKIVNAIAVLNDNLNVDDKNPWNLTGEELAMALDINGVRTTLTEQRDALRDQLLEMGYTQGQINDLVGAVTDDTQKTGSEISKVKTSQESLAATTHGRLESLLGAAHEQSSKLSDQSTKLGNIDSKWGSMSGTFSNIDSKLGGILARNPVTNVNVTTPITVQVGVSEIQYRVQSLRTTIGGGGFI